MELVELENGYWLVHRINEPENMTNIYARAHGGIRIKPVFMLLLHIYCGESRWNSSGLFL